MSTNHTVGYAGFVAPEICGEVGAISSFETALKTIA